LVLWPSAFLDWCRRRYGDCFTIDTYAFGREIELANPELVRQIFTGDPDVLSAGEGNSILAPLVGPRSLMLLDGSEHARQRKLLMPPFHGERMAAYGRTMRAIAEEDIDQWPLGTAFPLHPRMQRITLEIILRTVFGLDEGSQLEDLRDALTRVLDRQSRPFDAIFLAPPLQRSLFGLTPWAGFLRDRDRADALIKQQIERRRTTAKTARRDDVLALLLDARDEEGRPMTDDELRDELVTLLAAGHETTASMLCWTIDLVLGNERVLAALHRELEKAGVGRPDADPNAVSRLPYLEATLREALRLRPVVPAVARRLKRPMKIGGFEIPAGELIVPVSFLTHRRAATYSDPEQFRPERFLDTKPDPYAWFPFGGGARRCVGMAFALFEMKIVLAAVLSRMALRRVTEGPSRILLRGVTLVPKGGARVIADRRAPRGEPRRMEEARGAT
jgi:cytochrome P450